MKTNLHRVIWISLAAHLLLIAGVWQMSQWQAEAPLGQELEEIVMVEMVSSLSSHVSRLTSRVSGLTSHVSRLASGDAADRELAPRSKHNTTERQFNPQSTNHNDRETRDARRETARGVPGGNVTLAQIRKRLARSLYYPLEAKRRGSEGRPIIQFKLHPDGSVAQARLVKSCGDTVLDQAALTTVQRAAPLPYYPQPITIPIVYKLN